MAAPRWERVRLPFHCSCVGGGPQGGGVDADLLALLERERLPATLFVNGRWVDANSRITAQLSGDPLVELANHGSLHIPSR
ncbi:MAG TPA: polysaccharide deacetylase family protein [Mycobacterium sp.]|nr:polysaccharide deacetylase family protein [Mycobacterium sp.]